MKFFDWKKKPATTLPANEPVLEQRFAELQAATEAGVSFVEALQQSGLTLRQYSRVLVESDPALADAMRSAHANKLPPRNRD
jgi:hypothetical protein